jgi:hypothetical protein
VDNGFKGDGVYFNVNNARHLELEAGGAAAFKLLPIRVWQAMEGVTENYFIEPDYDIEVLGDRDALEYEWKGSPGSRYAELRGLAEGAGGVAVLRVTYAPLKLIHRNGTDSAYFNAINPIDTGIVVVSVVPGGARKGLETNIAAREYDTFYFDKGRTDHAEYSFKPDGPDNRTVSVRVHRPVHQGKGGAEWGKGWSDGRKGADGVFTVDLYEGRNIVEVAAGGASPDSAKKYHVIDARGVTVSVKDGTGADRRPGDALSPGEELEIAFDGIRTPLEKIAAIYNPGYPDTCYVSYKLPDGGEARSDGVQYDLSDKNAVKAVVPASGVLRLTGGTICCGHMGDPLDSHRDPERVLGKGLTPNFSAVAVPPGRYGALPDIALGMEGAGGPENGAGGGGCAAGGLGLAGFLLLGAALARGQTPVSFAATPFEKGAKEKRGLALGPF